MKHSRFTEEQIIGILRQQAAAGRLHMYAGSATSLERPFKPTKPSLGA